MVLYFRYSQITKYGSMETDYTITKVPLETIKPCVHMYVHTYIGSLLQIVLSITLRDCFVE